MTATTVTPPPANPPLPRGPIGAVPPPPAGPTPHRWTIAEYRQLDRTGLFRDKKTMLLYGEFYAMTLPNPPHDLGLGLVDDWLRTVFATGHHVRNQMGFDIGTDSDPGPDLAVVVGSRRDLAGCTPTTAVLVVEVAASSLAVDTTTKAELYATAGVPEYWVLDVDNKQLHVFRDPQPLPLPTELAATAYRTRLTLGSADHVSPLAASHASVLVGDLLP